jgi:hypothetical protein
LYGLLSIAVLAAFIHLNYYRPREGYNFYEDVDPNVIVDDSSALAPHGVPTNPIARSLSRQNVQQSPDQSVPPKPDQWPDSNNSSDPFKREDPYLDPNQGWGQSK